jgi:pilus assembly protein Flp/PilA
MLKKSAAFLRNEQGATAIEYGLIVGLIAAVVIAILTTTGTNLNSLFTTISGALP